MLPNFIFITILSALISFSLTPLTIYLAGKFGFVDDSRVRPHPAHTHSGVIPRAGGIPLFLGIFLPLSFLIGFNQQIIAIFSAALILVMVGLWDDIKDRSPYVRFIINCVAALLVIMAGVNITYITNPLGGIIRFDTFLISIDLFGKHSIPVWSSLLTIIWIVWTTNIIGWSGGVDGQLPGFVSISAIIIGLLSLRYLGDPNQYYVTVLSFLTAGSFLGFLPWNFFPQKIMPGYGGKTLAGFMLAILSILSFSKLGTALLVLAVPMTDAVFIFTKRILSGKSPVKASTGHLHHHLLSLGWDKRKIALFYWCISALAGIPALFLNYKQKAFAGVLIIIVLIIFISWINFLRSFPKSLKN